MSYQKIEIHSYYYSLLPPPPPPPPVVTLLLMTMEVADHAPSTTAPKKSSSFRLRSPSLNSIRLRRTFDLFDKNGDGTITIHDLSQALSVLGLDADFSEFESTIKSYIRPGNDGLEFEDFVSLHQSLDNAFFGDLLLEGEGDHDKHQEEEADLSEAFKVFDEDGDGYISARELQVVLKKLGLPEAKEIDRVQQMIVSVDGNHDGRVDFFEFKDMMRRSLLVRSS